jgi:hypothetical protein
LRRPCRGMEQPLGRTQDVPLQLHGCRRTRA